uniref:Putative group i salivary lipocalin n=1 Tax=Rhipicephalus pulchellus TaxID=72859 RepID=L7LTE6_RHIPC
MNRELKTAVAPTKEAMRAVALFLVFGLFIDVHGANLQDLIDALNTTKTIWLYNQSYQASPEAPNRTCVRWHFENLTSSSYLFENYYRQDGLYHSEERTHATLSGPNNKPTMNVNYTSEGKNSTYVLYTLQAWYPKEECFVLTRGTDKDKLQCELHLWSSQIDKKHDSCEEKYRDLCREPGPEVFTKHDCM